MATPVQKFVMAVAEAGFPPDRVDPDVASWPSNRGVPWVIAKRAEKLVADPRLHLGFIPFTGSPITICSAWIEEVKDNPGRGYIEVIP